MNSEGFTTVKAKKASDSKKKGTKTNAAPVTDTNTKTAPASSGSGSGGNSLTRTDLRSTLEVVFDHYRVVMPKEMVALILSYAAQLIYHTRSSNDDAVLDIFIPYVASPLPPSLVDRSAPPLTYLLSICCCVGGNSHSGTVFSVYTRTVSVVMPPPRVGLLARSETQTLILASRYVRFCPVANHLNEKLMPPTSKRMAEYQLFITQRKHDAEAKAAAHKQNASKASVLPPDELPVGEAARTERAEFLTLDCEDDTASNQNAGTGTGRRPPRLWTVHDSFHRLPAAATFSPLETERVPKRCAFVMTGDAIFIIGGLFTDKVYKYEFPRLRSGAGAAKKDEKEKPAPRWATRTAMPARGRSGHSATYIPALQQIIVIGGRAGLSTASAKGSARGYLNKVGVGAIISVPTTVLRMELAHGDRWLTPIDEQNRVPDKPYHLTPTELKSGVTSQTSAVKPASRAGAPPASLLYSGGGPKTYEPPYAHAACLWTVTDPTTGQQIDRIITSGGWNGRTASTSMRIMDVVSGKWQVLQTTLRGGPRYDHTMCIVDQTWLYVLGGAINTTPQRLNLNTWKWNETPLCGFTRDAFRLLRQKDRAGPSNYVVL